MPLRDAIIEANRVRLLPILMTTFSIIAGLIPTAIGTGAGASQRSAIAVTIIGGQTRWSDFDSACGVDRI